MSQTYAFSATVARAPTVSSASMIRQTPTRSPYSRIAQDLMSGSLLGPSVLSTGYHSRLGTIQMAIRPPLGQRMTGASGYARYGTGPTRSGTGFSMALPLFSNVKSEKLRVNNQALAEV